MLLTKSTASRCRLLQQASVAAACVAAPALEQPGKLGVTPRSGTVAQLVDASQVQQDVSKDFF